MLKLALVFAILLFVSCKKDTVNLDILTSKTWRPTLVDKNTSSNPQGNNLYYALLNCEKDDIYKFQPDGKLVVNHGSNECNDAETTIETLSYSYNRTTKELMINGVKYIVAEETSSQLKYYTATSSMTTSNNLIFLFE